MLDVRPKWQLLHRFRQQAVEQRTALVNQIRGALLEEGIAVPQGIARLPARLPRVLEDAENGLHDLTRLLIHDLSKQPKALDESINDYDNQIQELANNDDICRLLITIPGIGPLIATALRAAVRKEKHRGNVCYPRLRRV